MNELTFPRAARIRARADFSRVFDQARRTSDPLLSLHWLASDTPARLGLAVSRKVDRRAVVRNRVKRTLREAFRQCRAQLAGGEYVVVARPPAAQAPPDRLRAAFERTLVRAGALPASAVGGTMRRLDRSPVSSSSTPGVPAG